MPISSLYFLSFAISLIMLASVIHVQKEKRESVFSFLYLILAMIHFGYMMLSYSHNVEEAILAYKITFLDSTILPYMILLCVLRICGIRRRKSVMLLAILSVATYIFGLTAGVNDWFYSNIEFFDVNGYSYITREYGPLHVMEDICVAITIIASIAVVSYAAFHRNTISYKVSSFCAAFIAIDVVAYLIQSYMGLKFEVLPFMYNLLEITLFFVVKKINGLDIGRDAYISKNLLKEYGYFAFDAEGCFLGCDDVARLYFPELNRQKIDLKINDKFLKEEFIVWENYKVDDYSTFKYFKRNGKDIKCSRRPMYSDATGRLIGYVVEFQDDTEHINNLNELKTMNEELTRAVDDAKRANQAKSIFLSRMSHEIRTPINAIIGMDEVILRETRDGQIRNYARTLGDSAKMLLMLINDLLDFSKIEAGKMELIEDSYDEIDVVNNAIQMVKQRALNKDLNLSVNIVDSLPARLYGDHLKIQQVVINLLTNAIKYTDAGSVSLEVSAEAGTSGMAYIKYAVKDTGIGIKDVDKDALFDAFTRTNLKRNNYIEGTGLGLSIVSNYVNMMGGHVDVESTFGEGSTFTAMIPQKVISGETISQKDLGTIEKRVYEEHAEKMLKAPNCRVLLVDDNDTNREVFKLLLKPSEMHIVEASSGIETIEILKEDNEFDIIFLDHMMPGLDGIETLKAIKLQQLVDSSTPIVALTANAINDARNLYLSNGFDDYISKPIQIKQLENILIKYLKDGMVDYVDGEQDVDTNLPELEEFDFEYAIRNLGTEDIVKQVAKNVYKSLPKHKECLKELFDNIDDSNSINRYRIEVHTLKSSAASVGAILLSKLCRVGEVAAIEEDVEKIKAITPIILEEIDKHYQRLKVFDNGATEVVERDQMSDDELLKKLQSIKEQLEDWDYDSAEEAIGWILSHKIDEKWHTFLAQLEQDITNLNADMAIESIEQIIR